MTFDATRVSNVQYTFECFNDRAREPIVSVWSVDRTTLWHTRIMYRRFVHRQTVMHNFNSRGCLPGGPEMSVKLTVLLAETQTPISMINWQQLGGKEKKSYCLTGNDGLPDVKLNPKHRVYTWHLLCECWTCEFLFSLTISTGRYECLSRTLLVLIDTATRDEKATRPWHRR